MERRDFFRSAGAFAAGILLDPAAGSGRGAAQPRSPGFRTQHLVTILLGNGARRMDVLEHPGRCRFQKAMAAEGTLFVDDYGETVTLHGDMVNEVLTGRAQRSGSGSQRPRFPTWNEYVRKKTAGAASDFWMLQGASYYRAGTWDVRHFSGHPDYGARYGATSLTMSKLFGGRNEDPPNRSPRELYDRNIEPQLGHAPPERRRIEDWLDGVLSSRAYEIPSTAAPVIERAFPIGDAQAIVLAGRLLRDLRPRMITVQVLALDDAHEEVAAPPPPPGDTGFETYLRHLETLDELIGSLWANIRTDPGLRATTSILIRPECGRDGEVDRRGRLGHTPGDPHAHSVWTSALGPDFAAGRVVRDRVDRRDLAPTITYLMTGQRAEWSRGRVRGEIFADRQRIPDLVPPFATESFSTT